MHALTSPYCLSSYLLSSCRRIILSSSFDTRVSTSFNCFSNPTAPRYYSSGDSSAPTMSRASDHKPSEKARKSPMVPRPSASVLLISPTNQVLLLHRVQTSSAFPSAHVFPGGNVSTYHDGEPPAPDHPNRHEDGEVYRYAAIRETFEESGILLAKNNGFGRLIEVEDGEREAGRKLVHKNEVPFKTWLAKKGGRADIENLIPFTRWITPTNVPKRFTTQMYLYFLPLPTSQAPVSASIGPLPTTSEAVIPPPTHDGGLEHTAARFLPAAFWLSMARSGEIILFPPQFFLLHHVSQYLNPDVPGALEPDMLRQQRKELRDFIYRRREGEPSWADACISPTGMTKRLEDGRQILGLERAGPELEGSGRRGVKEWVCFVRFTKEGPREVDVGLRSEVLGQGKEAKI
ncbi:hypothetical protein K402DRAFT_397450 [Aulographum hederae CBS 113979]|uniref:Nudix hydrolase domain-containing protein n=1 Tax=Aulographum hederae CBS 113979 TaxID=1176131 RepID=A0A6G1GP01_9PEZI|nr:hypothetical protein K402DRAFT_397450 [Aulographum hederae CBS 113979]